MNAPHTVIVVPTYNERNNLKPFIEKILSLGVENLSIVIVDDNSPDGTGERADSLARENEIIHVIHRKQKEGLGPAYIAGFTYALSIAADLVFEIDADFSHDPKHIPEMIEASRSYDLVLGSRYIPGGGVQNWSLLRRFVSYFGNLYARAVLQVPIKDLTGGYKCYRRSAIEALDITTLSSLGYVFQIETTYRLYKKKLMIHELPITFTERTEGSSKFNLGIFLGAFIKVLQLRFK